MSPAMGVSGRGDVKGKLGGESEEAPPGSLGETGEPACRGGGGRRQGAVTEQAGAPRGALPAAGLNPRFRRGVGGLTQDPVQGVSHVHGVELRG